MGTKALYVSALLLASWVPAAAQEPEDGGREGKNEVGGHIGLSAGTADGTALALGAGFDHFLTDRISLGPLVQIGITDHLVQVGPSMQVKYTLPIPEAPALALSAEGGLGLFFADRERPRKNTALSLLVPLGAGLGYEVGEGFSVGTRVYFNFADVFDDHFFSTWFLGASYRF